MSISIILDVAVGLFFIYFVLSTLASAINELVGNLLQRRSRNLAAFIIETFKPGTQTSLKSQAAGQPVPAQATKSPIDLAKEFYLTSITTTVPEARNYGNAFQKARDKVIVPKVDKSQNISFIPSKNFVQGVLEMIGFAEKTHTEVGTALKELGELVKHLPADSPLKTALSSAINQADNKIENVVSQLQAWFDGQMAQLSDLYKRQTQAWLFLIGFVIAFLLNINTLAIVNALATNPTLRGAVAEQANLLVQNNESASDVVTLSCNGTDYKSDNANAAWEYTKCQLDTMVIPFGWTQDISFQALFGVQPGQIFSPIIGILLTAFAISMGAPFWFDFIKLLTNRPSGSKSGDPSSS